MPFKVGVSTGLYYIAHTEELATILKKIGYALTRGTSAIEISGEVPHEITYTEGKEAINLAKKQGLDLAFHGSLTIPMCVPETTYWRDAHDHLQKSVRSSVHAGCIYVNVHACLREWLELITYAGAKLEITMCDDRGRFISEILFENKRLRKWFSRNMWKIGEGQYPNYILSDAELRDAWNRSHSEMRIQMQREVEKRRLKIRDDYLKTLPPEEAEEDWKRRSRGLPERAAQRRQKGQENT